MIIGLSGKKQSGKDTVAKIIKWLILGGKDINTHVKGIAFSFEDFGGVSNSYNIERISDWQTKQFAYKLKQIVCLLIGCTMEQLEDNDFKEKELGEEWNKPISNLRTRFLRSDERYIDNIPTEIMTPRKLLQLLGTECGRQIIHPSIWINALMSEYKPKVSYQNITLDLSKDEGYTKIGDPIHSDYPNWIITDVRFPDELKAIRDKGGIIIRIHRPTYYYLCDNCGAEDIRNYEFTEKDICPRCNYESEGNLTLVIPTGDTHESETALDGYGEFDYVIENNSNIDNLIFHVKNILTELKIIN